MVMRAVICKDDPTSHGGKVLEGNELMKANGRPIAHKGHMTYCPQCKGNFPIVEGLAFHSYAGKGTAIEGMKTACGATLIATTTIGFMMIDDRRREGEAEESASDATPARKDKHHGAFRAVDEATGEPVPGMPYRIDLPDGAVMRGMTDADGYTRQITGYDPATVKLHWES